MRPEQAFIYGLAVPLAMFFGIWLGWGACRAFHLKLEAHKVKLSKWHQREHEQPAGEPVAKPTPIAGRRRA